MEDSKIPRQATQLKLKSKQERLRINSMDIIIRDLKYMDTIWEKAEELTTDEAEWRQRVASTGMP